MLIGIARKYQPTGYMECEQCGGNSHQVRFASSEHGICLSCEQDTLKQCSVCDVEKPLTQYGLSMPSLGHRAAVCKKCKADSRRLKFSLGARCCVCNSRIEGKASGAKRYCQKCPKPAYSGVKVVIKSAFNVAAFLAKPWKMSPA